jgi:hypothetical protein
MKLFLTPFPPTFIANRAAYKEIEKENLLFATIEGPQSKKSEEMTLAQLAEFMLSRHFKDPINSSGGYSSALHYKERLCQ